MKRLGVLASACVLAMGLLVAAPAAWAGDGHSFGHSDGGFGDGFFHFGGFSVVHPGQSIQAAIDASNPGGTIFVIRGTYAEHLVITKRVNIIGFGATLTPPAGDAAPSPCSDPDPNTDGICIAGQFTVDDQGNPTITSYVQRVSITGLTVSGFGGSGIMQFAGQGSTFIANVATGNAGYGIAAFESTGTTELFNRAQGSGEAGLYIGDSHPANANLFANEVSDNGFGIFVRDAEHGSIFGNSSHDNCVGILFLADAPGPDGAFDVAGNSIRHNSKVCPPTGEGPQISGIGIAIAGAHDVHVSYNAIKDNTPGGDSFKNGGVVVFTRATTGPANNVVVHNLITGNQPDINSDGTGSGNVLQPNLCQTSQPDGLC
jgi:hypothetical protein